MSIDLEDKERVRTLYNTHFTRVDYNAGLQDEARVPIGGSNFKSADYSDLDKLIDEKDTTKKEDQQKHDDGTPDDFKPIHDYWWARQKAMLCEHCICDVFPDYHLVYALDTWTLRRYDKFGFTIETIDPPNEARTSKTWRVWDYKKEEQK